MCSQKYSKSREWNLREDPDRCREWNIRREMELIQPRIDDGEKMANREA